MALFAYYQNNSLLFDEQHSIIKPFMLAHIGVVRCDTQLPIPYHRRFDSIYTVISRYFLQIYIAYRLSYFALKFTVHIRRVLIHSVNGRIQTRRFHSLEFSFIPNYPSLANMCQQTMGPSTVCHTPVCIVNYLEINASLIRVLNAPSFDKVQQFVDKINSTLSRQTPLNYCSLPSSLVCVLYECFSITLIRSYTDLKKERRHQNVEEGQCRTFLLS